MFFFIWSVMQGLSEFDTWFVTVTCLNSSLMLWNKKYIDTVCNFENDFLNCIIHAAENGDSQCLSMIFFPVPNFWDEELTLLLYTLLFGPVR